MEPWNDSAAVVEDFLFSDHLMNQFLSLQLFLLIQVLTLVLLVSEVLHLLVDLEILF